MCVLAACFADMLRVLSANGGSNRKEPACSEEPQAQPPGREDPLEKGTVTHSRILAWRFAWTVEPDGLQSKGPQSQTLLSD